MYTNDRKRSRFEISSLSAVLGQTALIILRREDMQTSRVSERHFPLFHLTSSFDQPLVAPRHPCRSELNGIEALPPSHPVNFKAETGVLLVLYADCLHLSVAFAPRIFGYSICINFV